MAIRKLLILNISVTLVLFFVLAACLALFVEEAKAGEFNYGLTLASNHGTSRELDDGRKLNEKNPGAFLAYYYDNTGGIYSIAGMYKNTIHKTSTYAGVGFRKNLFRYVDYGTEFGLVHGYDTAPVTPAARFLVWVGRIKLGYAPRYKDENSYSPRLVTFELEFK